MIPGFHEGKICVQDEHGYVYNKKHQLKDGSSTWSCRRTGKKQCKAVIKILDHLILWQRQIHNHAPWKIKHSLFPTSLTRDSSLVVAVSLQSNGNVNYRDIPKVPKGTPYTLLPGKRPGAMQLQDDVGFVYCRGHATSEGGHTWTCKKRQTKWRCGAIVKVIGDEIVWQRREHNHTVFD